SWNPTEDNPDCGNASDLLKNTAGWFDTCAKPDTSDSAPKYFPPIDQSRVPSTIMKSIKQQCGLPGDASPQQIAAAEPRQRRCIIDAVLNERAKAGCLSGSLVQQRECITNAKLEIIRAEIPEIFKDCSGDTDFAECVHFDYVFGTERGGGARSMSKSRDISSGCEGWDASGEICLWPLPKFKAGLRESPLQNSCVTRPVPGGFGATACAPIRRDANGDFHVDVDSERPDGSLVADGEATNFIKLVDQRQRNVAAAAVLGAIRRLSTPATDLDQACVQAAFESAYG